MMGRIRRTLAAAYPDFLSLERARDRTPYADFGVGRRGVVEIVRDVMRKRLRFLSHSRLVGFCIGIYIHRQTSIRSGAVLKPSRQSSSF